MPQSVHRSERPLIYFPKESCMILGPFCLKSRPRTIQTERTKIVTGAERTPIHHTAIGMSEIDRSQDGSCSMKTERPTVDLIVTTLRARIVETRDHLEESIFSKVCVHTEGE